jgi:hypothetical protein
MPKLGVSGITIDARDPGGLAAWWGEALGWTTTGRVCHPPAGAGYRIEFMPVDDAKQIKNRVHLDVVLRDPEGNEFCVGGPPAAEPHAD